jgi:K319-like protein
VWRHVPTVPATIESARRRVVVLGLATLVASTLLQTMVRPASADDIAATEVRSTPLRTTGNATFDPPSPDPSGLVYLPSTSQLLISDSEVEEMSIWAGANLFTTGLDGSPLHTASTIGYTNEPAGLAFDPSPPGTRPTSGHLFVSDDGTLRVTELAPGSDGVVGTTDDVVVRTIDAGAYGAGDAEDIAFDSDRGDLYVAEGIRAEVWRLSPGTNGVFDGLPPGGDDATSHFDVHDFGAEDTEGITYDPVRDTLLVADRITHTIYEVHEAGLLVNRITLPETINHPADVAVAPASAGGQGSHLYVVTRGFDNDQDPLENDGMLYELEVSLPPIGDLSPRVDAGPNQGVALPTPAVLQGYVADEDVSTTSTTWSQVSGPGTATIQDPSAASTSFTMPTAGTYVFRLAATDAQGNVSMDDVTVYAVAEGTTILRRPVAIGYDDAEEAVGGNVALGGSDLELVNDGKTRGDQTVGVRFTNVTVPRAADVTNAYIQFEADRITTGTVSLLVQAQAADNPDRFRTTARSISSRPRVGGVSWTPPAWNTPGAAGVNERTPDLGSLVQAVVDRDGWRSGNAIVFIITGTGKRAAESFDGQAAPILHVEYTDNSGNEPPIVSAGPDRQVTLPNGATLSGSVTDDGDPIPPGAITMSWSIVSAPQSVEFSDASSATTDVAFSESGTYVLRLTASDGFETVSDDVTVVVASNTGSVVNLIGNPGFETSTTGWNAAGSATGVTLARVDAGVTTPHSGSASARLSNGATTTADICKLNDQPNWVTNAAGGSYRASLWANNATGGKLNFRIREYNASGALVDTSTAQLTLTGTWQQVTVTNTAAAAASLDVQAWTANTPPGICFYVDDVILTRT